MICPECGGEYRSGFTVCADCNVALVESLDDVAGVGGDHELEVLLSTRDPEELGALTELLEEARIPYVVHAGTAMSLAEGGHLADPGEPDYWEARLWAYAARLAEGKELLAALRAHRARPSS